MVSSQQVLTTIVTDGDLYLKSITVIGDLATLMGKAMGLKDTVTAITFVALGTSLPDTFASKTAGTQL